MNSQPNLFESAPPPANVEWLVSLLSQEDWVLSKYVLEAAGKPDTEHNRRWVRHLADHSGGRVIGGQRGYKLTRHCPPEEYDHWRNAMLSQAREMQRRVLEADKIFHLRQPVCA